MISGLQDHHCSKCSMSSVPTLATFGASCPSSEASFRSRQARSHASAPLLAASENFPEACDNFPAVWHVKSQVLVSLLPTQHTSAGRPVYCMLLFCFRSGCVRIQHSEHAAALCSQPLECPEHTHCYLHFGRCPQLPWRCALKTWRLHSLMKRRQPQWPSTLCVAAALQSGQAGSAVADLWRAGPLTVAVPRWPGQLPKEQEQCWLCRRHRQCHPDILIPCGGRGA
mmetsp:Transcript_126090/g.251774  ORF Transcript_126090/g.251774 Transcript_126090/m.251774 type:complete len:226 (+) Transcript_126090:947-1624(+)